MARNGGLEKLEDFFLSPFNDMQKTGPTHCQPRPSTAKPRCGDAVFALQVNPFMSSQAAATNIAGTR